MHIDMFCDFDIVIEVMEPATAEIIQHITQRIPYLLSPNTPRAMKVDPISDIIRLIINEVIMPNAIAKTTLDLYPDCKVFFILPSPFCSQSMKEDIKKDRDK